MSIRESAGRFYPEGTPAKYSREEAVLRLCSELFLDPSRLQRVSQLQLNAAFSVKPHKHEDLLQCDLLSGWEGCLQIGQMRREFRGTVALAVYPHQGHSYDLKPVRPGASIFSLKLRVDESWPSIQQQTFPTVIEGLVGEQSLVGALHRLTRLAVSQETKSPLTIATLSEVLTLWPSWGSHAQANTYVDSGDMKLDRVLERVLELIETRLAHPPDSDELAAEAHFSTRHFARRFYETFGCTTHKYITARRLDRACQLLLQEDLNVTGVAEALGFSSVQSFSRWFHQHTGIAPGKYRTDHALL